MERLNVVHRQNRGFTLFEILVATVIAGILAALSLPSLLGILKGNELKAAQDQVVNALRDAQRQAIRRSQKCTITINTSSDPVKISVKDPTADKGCLSSSDSKLPKGVTLTSNNGNDFTYSFKGNTTNAKTLTLASSGSKEQRCVVVSMHLGILRTGIVKGSTCKTSSSTL